MKTTRPEMLAALAMFLLTVACSDGQRVARLRTAVDRAQISLGDSVAVAMRETASPVAVQAKLDVAADPAFSVGALGGGARRDVRVDIVSGSVLAVTAATSAGDPCPGSIPLADAIAVAEDAAGGRAVLIQPDDDDHCLREVQVLTVDKLMEVKLARDGAVLEQEEADGEDQ